MIADAICDLAKDIGASEVELVKRIERFLDWLADGETDAVVGEWFDENVLAVAQAIDYATRDPVKIWAVWLEEQELFDLDDNDRELVMTADPRPGRVGSCGHA